MFLNESGPVSIDFIMSLALPLSAYILCSSPGIFNSWNRLLLLLRQRFTSSLETCIVRVIVYRLGGGDGDLKKVSKSHGRADISHLPLEILVIFSVTRL